MARNTLMDMHNILMEQLERLNDDELSDEELEKEIKRSKALGDTAKVIVDNSKTILEAQKVALEYGIETGTPTLFQAEEKKTLEAPKKQ